MKKLATSMLIYNIAVLVLGYILHKPFGYCLLWRSWLSMLFIFFGLYGLLFKWNYTGVRTIKTIFLVFSFVLYTAIWAFANAFYFNKYEYAVFYENQQELADKYSENQSSFIELGRVNLSLDVICLVIDESEDDEGTVTEQLYWAQALPTDSTGHSIALIYDCQNECPRSKKPEYFEENIRFFTASFYSKKLGYNKYEQAVMDKFAQKKVSVKTPIFLYPVYFDVNNWRNVSKVLLVISMLLLNGIIGGFEHLKNKWGEIST